MVTKQLIYTSIAVADPTSTALDVLERAAVFNLSRRITGLLLLDHKAFAQVLEGRDADVDSLMERISADPRHGQVRIVSDYPISARMWPNWPLSIATPTPRNAPIFQRYGITANSGGRTLADLEPALLKALLLEFSEHAMMRRDNSAAAT